MKKFLSAILIFSVIILCGFKKTEKPYIILSSGTINQQNIQRVERFFKVNSRINYALIFPENEKYTGVRLQISTQDEKTTNWGYSVTESKDISLVPGDKIYRDYIVPRKKGHYIIQFFYLNKKNYPFAHKEFIVQ